MAVVAFKPRRGYSFTDHAVANPAAPPPGDKLDGEVDRIDRTLAQILDFLGTLTLPPSPSAHSLYTAPVGALGPSADIHSIPGADPNALAMDWAEVSAEWAEHMPDTIPPNILAVMGVTGDHWSARWWAHRALEIVAEAGGGLAVFVGPAPPPSPHAFGALWWDSVGGQLYLWFDDGSSSQWVPATNPPVVAAPPAANVLAPASGAVITLTDTRPVYVNNPAILASLTVVLPTAAPGSVVEIGFRRPVTVLTLRDGFGAAVPDAPTTAFGPGAAIELRSTASGWLYWK